jgi:hypothetical protein
MSTFGPMHGGMKDQPTYIEALASAGDELRGSPRREGLGSSKAPPAYLIESAEGTTTYAGFKDDSDSKRARRWLAARLKLLEEKYRVDAANDGPDAGPHKRARRAPGARRRRG